MVRNYDRLFSSARFLPYMTLHYKLQKQAMCFAITVNYVSRLMRHFRTFATIVRKAYGLQFDEISLPFSLADACSSPRSTTLAAKPADTRKSLASSVHRTLRPCSPRTLQFLKCTARLYLPTSLWFYCATAHFTQSSNHSQHCTVTP